MYKMKVALIEFSDSHDECLLTQLQALQTRNVEIILVIQAKVLERNPHFKSFVSQVIFWKKEKKAFAQWKQMRQFTKNLVRLSIQKVILNTAQGSEVRNLSWCLPKSIEAIGIIHTLRKFEGSFTQKVIHKKFKKYFVLSDDLLKKANVPKGIQVESFYPLAYPSWEGSTIQKDVNEYWVVLTGGVENRRKDLASMVSFLAQVPSNIRFIFLGKTDIQKEENSLFLKEIETYIASKQVIIFDSFVSPEVFEEYIKKADFLLPLIHPNTKSAEEYIHYQISGAFTLSFSYKIPLLIHEDYSNEEDLKTASFLYRLDTFGECLEIAIQQRDAKIEEIKYQEKWNISHQIEKYGDFVFKMMKKD